jgi:hypothetical protein
LTDVDEIKTIFHLGKFPIIYQRSVTDEGQKLSIMVVQLFFLGGHLVLDEMDGSYHVKNAS